MENCRIQTPEVCNSEPKGLQDWGVGYPRSSSGLGVLEKGVSSLEPGDERERKEVHRGKGTLSSRNWSRSCVWECRESETQEVGTRGK